ncbi:MAG TPA: glycosyltransferase family 4 protein [Solirubrobacteraceae bacterium]|nr:glycosyltransferase family 4 protein [Solirubrobacteraceae bacterium]
MQPLGASWRAQREAAQQAILPHGRLLISCPAPFGAGGLGRHVKELADAAARAGSPPAICMCAPALSPARPSGSADVREVRARRRFASPLARLARFSPSWRNLRRSVAFDRHVAAELPRAEHLLAFNGQALAQLQAAPGAGYGSRALVAANPHLRVLLRQHALAHRAYPLEGTWASRLLQRNLAEYERAERIYVASRYTWESFVQEGVPEERLALFPLTPDPRFTPAALGTAGGDDGEAAADDGVAAPDDGEAAADDGAAAPDDGAAAPAGTFDVVFVGRLCVTKGVPLLVDAVRRLGHADLRLVLVGGWSSRGMRRFLQRACATDARIAIGPGDPLPRLRRAALFAHPAYEDGFAYAPAEALACGVPVLASEDTGMKELIEPGVSGMVLPTGDLDALTEAIDAAYRGELLSGRV